MNKKLILTICFFSCLFFAFGFRFKDSNGHDYCLSMARGETRSIRKMQTTEAYSVKRIEEAKSFFVNDINLSSGQVLLEGSVSLESFFSLNQRLFSRPLLPEDSRRAILYSDVRLTYRNNGVRGEKYITFSIQGIEVLVPLLAFSSETSTYINKENEFYTCENRSKNRFTQSEIAYFTSDQYITLLSYYKLISSLTTGERFYLKIALREDPDQVFTFEAKGSDLF